MDSDKNTRDATENCYKITNLLKKDNLKPHIIKKAGLSRVELTFADTKKANQCVLRKSTR